MPRIQTQPSWWKRFFYSRVFVIFLVVLVVILARSAWQTFWHGRVATDERKEATTEIARLEARREQLLAEIAALGTERGIEVEIRERFSVAREGELVINVLPVKEEELPVDTRGLWQKLVDGILGW